MYVRTYVCTPLQRINGESQAGSRACMYVCIADLKFKGAVYVVCIKQLENRYRVIVECMHVQTPLGMLEHQISFYVRLPCTSVCDPCMGDETGGVAALSEGGRVGGTGSPPRQRWMRYMAMANSLLVRAPSPSTSARVHIWKGGGGKEGLGRVKREMKEEDGGEKRKTTGDGEKGHRRSKDGKMQSG